MIKQPAWLIFADVSVIEGASGLLIREVPGLHSNYRATQSLVIGCVIS